MVAVPVTFRPSPFRVLLLVYPKIENSKGENTHIGLMGLVGTNFDAFLADNDLVVLIRAAAAVSTQTSSVLEHTSL